MLVFRSAYRAMRVLPLGFGLLACGSTTPTSRPGDGAGGTISAGLGGSTSGGGAAGSIGLGAGGQQAGGQIVTGPTTDGGGMGCQNLQVLFTPKIPTVFVLVDRSGSMFDSNVWVPLRTAVLGVIQQTQADIRYGFGAFSGLAGSATMCPDFSAAPSIALNNYASISTLYNQLDRPAYKAETPTTLALRQAQTLLTAQNDPGDKYILFVTDGEPDFCDDSNHICAVDSVVHELQTLKAAGTTTLVFGLKSTASDISSDSLQAFANAGTGQPVLAPIAQMPAPLNIYYQCSGVMGWTMELGLAGKTGMMTSIATYSPTGGNATLYNPDLTNPDAGASALVDQLTSAIAGVKSCLFDLAGKIEVDVNQLNLASVSVEGQTVPLDAANGWRMNNSTQLELVGNACANWRKPENTHIDFNFPCGVIIVK
jgi:hypothetical protein